MIKIYNKDEALQRLDRSASTDPDILESVKKIVADVNERGDTALFEYTERFDKCKLNESNFIVSKKEIEEAFAFVPDELLASMRKAAGRIRDYHERQKRQSWFDSNGGQILGQLIRPLKRVGIYAPGGRAAYPSSVLMNAIPAKVAGVSEIFMASPCDKNGKLPALTIVAAYESGVDKIYKMGGAQAVSALAYGTKLVQKVDKITGPGNIYVTLAKREVFGQVGIDMTAGPSEVLILADSGANPVYIAADLLAQAEHDPLAAAMLITDSREIAEKVRKELEKQIESLPRKDIALASIRDHGGIILVDDLETDALSLANEIAAEHLELLVDEPFSWLGKIENAGAIFLGEHSPESLGDYMAGPNHVLPTNSTSRFFSPLSVDDFVKKSSVIYFDRKSLELYKDDIVNFASAEGLDAHARSAAIRFDD